MSLVEVSLPSPAQLRGGWAAMATVCVARGCTDSVWAEGQAWFFHDGGGNWATLRFAGDGRAVLIGHDHEYTETYFRDAARYLQEPETDLLAGAPAWWSDYLDPLPLGEWIGFVYGWDGQRWQRANYEACDGFDQVGLLDCCSVSNVDQLREHAQEAPGLNGVPPSDDDLQALVDADLALTEDQLAKVVPGWDTAAGVKAGREFFTAPLH
ncbi:MAG: hypothetical protein NXI04_13745 [Planctomycetaceae bacterium]|nr:hypothetical protein [Planctomycetaceae bacterium]